MPSHPIHKVFKKIILKKQDMTVDEIMGFPASFAGKGHRKYLHDPLSLVVLFGNDPEKLREAILHKLVDEAFTKHPESRRFLEVLMGISPGKSKTKP